MKINDLATKIISEEDGYISFAIKAQVENNSHNEEISIELQGLDSDGFVFAEIRLEGNIPLNESKILTAKKDFVEKKIFEQIVEWQEK